MSQQTPISRRQFIHSTIATLAATTLCRQLPSPGAVARATQPAVGFQIPIDFVGLSYETMQLADPSFFSARNGPLVSLFRDLSPRGVLRLGGNSSEYCWWKASPDQKAPAAPPHPSESQAAKRKPRPLTAIEPAAIDELATFLDATGWTTIYGLNLGTGTPARAAEEASYVAAKLGSRLLYFQIGNEPDLYTDTGNNLRSTGWNFDQYLDQWMAFARAVIEKLPSARFGGPDISNATSWVVRFAQEAPKQLPNQIVACTGHYYAEGPPDNPKTTVAHLLTPDPRLPRDVPQSVAAARAAGLPFRMTEGNSCYLGGKPGVSNVFCSALWVADYMVRMAKYGAVGVNIHGGGNKQIRQALGGHLQGETLTADGPALARQGSFYTPIAGSMESGFNARPIFYGMKLAGLLAGGVVTQADVSSTGPAPTSLAVRMPDGQIRLVVINKDAQTPVTFRFRTQNPGHLWRLEAPSLTSPSGVTLAGAEIRPDHEWSAPQEEHVAPNNGIITVDIAPASAVALFCSEP